MGSLSFFGFVNDRLPTCVGSWRSLWLFCLAGEIKRRRRKNTCHKVGEGGQGGGDVVACWRLRGNPTCGSWALIFFFFFFSFFSLPPRQEEPNGSFSPLRGQHCRIYGTTHLSSFLKTCVACIKEKGERGLEREKRWTFGSCCHPYGRSVAVKSVPAFRPVVSLVHRELSDTQRDSDERIDNEQSAPWRNLISRLVFLPSGDPSSEIHLISCLCVTQRLKSTSGRH